MNGDRGAAIAQNFEYFQSVVRSLVHDHCGKFALLRNAAIVDYYDSPASALTAGATRFPDHLFSIQKVTDQPFDLGFLAYGASDRAAD